MSKVRSAAVEREALRQWNRGEPLSGREVVEPVQLSLDDAALALEEAGPLAQSAIGGIEGAACGWRAIGECSLIASSACSLACMLAHRRRGRR